MCQVNLAHPARAQTLDDLVWANGAPEVYIRRIIAENVRVLCDGRLLYKVPGFVKGTGQRRRFPFQLVVAPARFVQKGCALKRRAIERPLQDIFHPLPSLRCHKNR